MRGGARGMCAWRRPVARAVVASQVLAVAALAGCDGGGDTLPGRSRPILEHDWPDPGELILGPSAFTPSDPAAALLETSSGTRAYIVPGADSDPLVRLTAALPLGRLHEAEGEAGASALLTRLITTRTPIGATRPLSLLLAELGTSLTTVETLDAVHISLHVLPEDWQAGLELLIAVVRNPDLDAATIREHRAGPGYTMPMAGIGGAGYRPKVELERRIQGYPLAPPDPGTTVSPGAVRALASRALAADRVVFGVGGPAPRDEVVATLETATRGWAPSGQPAPQPATITPREPSTRFHAVDVPSLEGWIAIGRAIGTVPESDRAALAVLRFILAERLNIAAREVRGLANRDDFEIPETGSGTGLLLVRTGGRPEAVAPLVRYSMDEIARIHDPEAPVTESEVARAQGWLVDAVWRRSLELATTASVTFAVEHVRRGGTAQLMAWSAALQTVTPDDVNAVAQAYLDPLAFVTVVAGPLERIRAARHPRWPVALDELEAELTGTR
ncbi:MAG: insulinase family protein [Gemmatimonadetes bacterium]|nr:insulinase family protein [Gemmatimonadota bacterium]MYG22363.1 insulinase family protein [Gemmatimonadota bacterium]MYJ38405.1 insulinase family protein [Gemmatimonadota bacterium]